MECVCANNVLLSEAKNTIRVFRNLKLQIILITSKQAHGHVTRSMQIDLNASVQL